MPWQEMRLVEHSVMRYISCNYAMAGDVVGRAKRRAVGSVVVGCYVSHRVSYLVCNASNRWGIC